MIEYLLVHVEGNDAAAALPRFAGMYLGLERSHLKFSVLERLRMYNVSRRFLVEVDPNSFERAPPARPGGIFLTFLGFVSCTWLCFPLLLVARPFVL
jgi:hypothetical protein|eukprot:COSAG01_NODE_8763_length_2667_cov_9.123442_2_plen_97_part_00